MFRSRPISLLLVGLFVWLAGCTSYKQIEAGQVSDHGKVRVTLTNGQRETVLDARIEADTLKGRIKEGIQRPEWIAHAISLDRVAELEAVGTNVGGTVLTVLGISMVLLAAIGAAACAGSEDMIC